MINTIKKTITDLPVDGAIYLIKKLSRHSGFFCSGSHVLYVVNNFEKIEYKSLITDYLKLHTNVEVNSVKNNQNFESGRYNILELLPTENGYDDDNLESFVNLCVSHTEFMDCRNFVKFFFSLSELFQEPKKQEYKNLVGFFGELTFIRFLCNKTSIDLSDCWHKSGSQDKYEITLETKNIEIKTTSSIDEEVTIKHAQLFNNDNNYLIVVCIEESSAGETLNQLINSMKSNTTHYNNYNFILNVERERKRVSPVDADNRRFSLKSIVAYDAKDINPFKDVPENVSHLTYKIDLISQNEIEEKDWMLLFAH